MTGARFILNNFQEGNFTTFTVILYRRKSGLQKSKPDSFEY